MLPFTLDLATGFALMAAAFTLLLAMVFLFSPQRGLELTKHHADKLPLIMVGRYLFMSMIIVGVVIGGSEELLAYLFMGLAGVAFFDAAIYAQAKRSTLPHIGAGSGALMVSALALGVWP